MASTFLRHQIHDNHDQRKLTAFTYTSTFLLLNIFNLFNQSSLSIFLTVPQNNMIASRSALFMADDKNPVERGVSMDQDGKSNVWAIEPKMEIENKSSEEKTGSVLLAVGGLAIFGAVAAAALTNLPDPNQF